MRWDEHRAEVIMARYHNIEVVGVSCITNLAAGISSRSSPMMKFLRWAAPRRESLPGYSPNFIGRYEIQFAKVRKLLAAAKAASETPTLPTRSSASAPRSSRRAARCTRASMSRMPVTTHQLRRACCRRQGRQRRASQVQAIAVVAPSAALSPCGACRQVLAEFGECVVICADSRQHPPFAHPSASQNYFPTPSSCDSYWL